MLDKRKYDPTDLESLMLNKSFDELYDEEKRFVLSHTDSREEYESLRATLLMINERKDGTSIAPRKGMKADLLAEFAGEEKKGFWIWLNGILPIVKAPKRRQFAYALAIVLPLLVVSGLWFFSPKNEMNLAEAKSKTEFKEELEAKKQGEKEEKKLDKTAELEPAAELDNSSDSELQDEVEPEDLLTIENQESTVFTDNADAALPSVLDANNTSDFNSADIPQATIAQIPEKFVASDFAVEADAEVAPTEDLDIALEEVVEDSEVSEISVDDSDTKSIANNEAMSGNTASRSTANFDVQETTTSALQPTRIQEEVTAKDKSSILPMSTNALDLEIDFSSLVQAY